MTSEQGRQLIEAAEDDRHRALYVTALGTGLRQRELLSLRWVTMVWPVDERKAG